MMVFVCHAWIVSTSEFELVLSPGWQMFLKTPAWAGVWIFMVLSGFFSGSHWNKHELSRQNIIEYYVSRALKILVPTYGFIAIVYILHEPTQFLKANVILRMLTLTFNGEGGAGRGIGATWYVFSLFWLYLLSPFLEYAWGKVQERCFANKLNIVAIWLGILALGGVFRCTACLLEFDWYSIIYASPFGNLDLFAVGFLTAKYIKNEGNHTEPIVNLGRIKVLFVILLMLLVLTNIVFYYYGEVEVAGGHPYSILIAVYRYIFPSAYGFMISIYIWLFHTASYRENYAKRVLSWLSDHTFQFYLWHTIVLYNMTELINTGSPIMNHIILLIFGCFVTLIVSYLFGEMWRTIEKGGCWSEIKG